MIERGAIERPRERSCTADEVIPEEALMNCHMVTTDLAVEVDAAELTVMLRVQEAQEWQSGQGENHPVSVPRTFPVIAVTGVGHP